MLNATQESMKEELVNAIAQGSSLDEIKDNSHEWIDGYLPIYNNQIIEEWKNMPSEYDDRGSAELGHMGEVTIVGLMSLDLYLYYTDLFNEVIEDMEEDIAHDEEEVSA